jgi:hypothetical protein
MGLRKKISLLTLSLVLLTLPALAGVTSSVSASTSPQRIFSQKASNTVTASKFLFLFGNIHVSVPDFPAFETEEVVVPKICKQKKKYKRILPGSSTLRQPVRDIDIIPQNIYIKETYSKPFFISPLHRFLFRLTPF